MTLDLESIVISPTVARAVFSIDGASADEYALVGRIRHDGKVLADGGGVVAAGSLQLTTGTGVDDPSGEWEVTVTELVGMGSDRPSRALDVPVQRPVGGSTTKSISWTSAIRSKPIDS